MMRRSRKVLAACCALAALGSVSNQALAWGCTAVSDSGGAYGYSYEYSDRGDAEDRALEECTSRTSEICEITECVEGS